jgi:chorismate lyase/3-hydroxybenzoate synthase
VAQFNPPAPRHGAAPTASGDLVVHCLASEDGGRAVHNPRQRQPWTYSARYGPRAPSFSRGVVAEVAGRVLLMLGGTASILGEDSVHIGDASAQVAETLENMAAVISTAAAREEPASHALARLVEIRVYLSPDADQHAILAELRARLAAGIRMEAWIARLCRPELLVEIEGVAALPSG